jgi:hypothetical protein
MSIDDNTSENTPVIKSRTGKFLQGMFDKKAPVRNMPRTKSTPTNQQEFMQVVPEPITWDEGEETNWDDDFIEAPQPAFVAPTVEKSPVTPPPPPPKAFKTATPEPVTESTSTAIDPIPPESLPDLSQPSIPEPTVDRHPPAPPAISTPSSFPSYQTRRSHSPFHHRSQHSSSQKY